MNCFLMLIYFMSIGVCLCEAVKSITCSWITDSGELPCGCWELNPNPLDSSQCSQPLNHLSSSKPMSFTEVSYRNMGKGLLTGAQMIQRQLYPQGPLQHGDSSQSWGPREHCTSCRQLHGLEGALPRCPNGLKFPGSWAGFCFFQTAGLGVLV